MKERTLVFVILVFRLKIVSSVPMSSTSTAWHLATKDVIDVITSVEEFKAALLFLDLNNLPLILSVVLCVYNSLLIPHDCAVWTFIRPL